MPFTVTPFPIPAGTAYKLEGPNVRSEVWPTHGFNCLRWQIDGGDLLDVAPDWDTNPVPTRSGHPVLFPFPNRMRGGSFTFDGKTYQLPKNESTGVHAIHGFTPRNPWRVLDTKADATSASLTGQLRLSQDVPAAVWPADAEITLTYTLTATALRVDAGLRAADGKRMPVGLGYHGYFKIPTATGSADSYSVSANASRQYLLDGGLPTGERPPVAGDTDFRRGRILGSQVLDHLFGAVGSDREDGPLCEVAVLSAPPAPGRLSVWVSAEFRELLLFTPVHRRSVAIEPYTCASDAMNLGGRGIDGGWLVLDPGVTHHSTVEYRWDR